MNTITERRGTFSISWWLLWIIFLKLDWIIFTWYSLSFIIYENFLKIFEKENLELGRLMITKIQWFIQEESNCSESIYL